MHALSLLANSQNATDLHNLLVYSWLALAIMAVLSVALGWLIAGRVLRPLRTITTTARSISATNLHERLALGGPDDELKELGNTFDALLAGWSSSSSPSVSSWRTPRTSCARRSPCSGPSSSWR